MSKHSHPLLSPRLALQMHIVLPKVTWLTLNQLQKFNYNARTSYKRCTDEKNYEIIATRNQSILPELKQKLEEAEYGLRINYLKL